MGKFFGILVLLVFLAFSLIFFNQSWAQGNRMIMDWGAPFSSIENPPLAKIEREKKFLRVINDIRTGPWMSNVDTLHGKLLWVLAETVNARNIVEIGTAKGYSAFWICLGLQITGSKLITHEIDPRAASLAR